MRHMKRSNTYKNSTGTLTFDPESGHGYSYDWYRIVERIGDLYVLNTYNYSPTTIKHIYKMRDFLTSTLGAHNIIHIEAPRGLQRLDLAVEHYQDKIRHLTIAINKKGSRKTTNERRQAEMQSHIETMKTIYTLINTQALSEVA